MKLLLAVCLVAMVAGAPPPRNVYSPDNVHVESYENDNIGLGPFRYSFKQSDGTRADQTGELRNEGREDEHVAVTGSFSWIGPDGITYLIRYTAGVEGYKPEIEQGPGPGSVPPAVVASLLG